jgi:hypothetical protein
MDNAVAGFFTQNAAYTEEFVMHKQQTDKRCRGNAPAPVLLFQSLRNLKK